MSISTSARAAWQPRTTAKRPSRSEMRPQCAYRPLMTWTALFLDPLTGCEHDVGLAARLALTIEPALPNGQLARRVYQNDRGTARTERRIQNERGGKCSLPFRPETLKLRPRDGGCRRAIREYGEELFGARSRRGDPGGELSAYAGELRPRGVEQMVTQTVEAGCELALKRRRAIRCVVQAVRVAKEQIESGVGLSRRRELLEERAGGAGLSQKFGDERTARGRPGHRRLHVAKVRDDTEATGAVDCQPRPSRAQIASGENLGRTPLRKGRSRTVVKLVAIRRNDKPVLGMRAEGDDQQAHSADGTPTRERYGRAAVVPGRDESI